MGELKIKLKNLLTFTKKQICSISNQKLKFPQGIPPKKKSLEHKSLQV